MWRFSFTDTNDSQDSRGRKGASFFLPTSSTRSKTYNAHLQLCVWNYFEIFLIQARNLRGERGRSPLFFFEIGKKCPNFGKKMPWLCPSWVKFLILNVVLRVSRRKKPIFLFCRAFLSCVVDEMFIDVPWFRENTPALKNSWLCTCNCIACYYRAAT